MRALTLFTLSVGVLVGLPAAWAAGPIERRVTAVSISGPQLPSTVQLGQVVGSFTYPNPPVEPYHNVVGIADDGDGLAVAGDRLYVTTMVGGAVATVVIFDVADALSSTGCDILEDGFESGDASAWSGVEP